MIAPAVGNDTDPLMSALLPPTRSNITLSYALPLPDEVPTVESATVKPELDAVETATFTRFKDAPVVTVSPAIVTI